MEDKASEAGDAPNPEQPEGAVQGAVQPELPEESAGARAKLGFVLDVPLRVTVEIGCARMRVGEVLQLNRGSVIELDRMTGEPVDVLVNGRLVAHGEVTTVGERLAVRLLDMVGRPEPRAGGD